MRMYNVPPAPVPGGEQHWELQVLYRDRDRDRDGQGSGHGTTAAGDRTGPLVVDRCMSCDKDCPLALGVLGYVPTADQAAQVPANAAAPLRSTAESPASGTGAAAAVPASASASTTTDGTSYACSPAPPPSIPPPACPDPAAPLAPPQPPPPPPHDWLWGVTSADTLVLELPRCRCWLDAKGRPMVVLTPVAHRERLAELDEGDLSDLLAALPEAMARLSLPRIECVLLNHGDRRNHAHLHVKVGRGEGGAAALRCCCLVGWCPCGGLCTQGGVVGYTAAPWIGGIGSG